MQERKYPNLLMVLGWIFLAGSLPLIWIQVSERVDRPWDPSAGISGSIHALSILAIPLLLCVLGMHIWLAINIFLLWRRRLPILASSVSLNFGITMLLVSLYVPQSAYEWIWIKSGGPKHNSDRVMQKTVLYGKEGTIVALVEGGANPNGEVSDKSYLMIAAERGQTAVIKELLKRGAEPGRQTKGGYRAVDFAQENGQPHAVRLLIEAGSPPPRTIIEIPRSSVTVQETK